jgi:hypothetical protein
MGTRGARRSHFSKSRQDRNTNNTTVKGPTLPGGEIVRTGGEEMNKTTTTL